MSSETVVTRITEIVIDRLRRNPMADLAEHELETHCWSSLACQRV